MNILFPEGFYDFATRNLQSATMSKAELATSLLLARVEKRDYQLSVRI